MRPSQKRLLIATLVWPVLLFMGCERDTYTSWKCVNEAGEKSTMVLKKAQMQFAGKDYRYCGSLGPNSYFDDACPAITQAANITFTPSNGALLSRERPFQCEAL